MVGVSYWLDNSQKGEWKTWINKLPPIHRDVYFDPEYVALYENKLTSANYFIYANNRDVFVYAFLKQSIEQTEDYFDITTPYGYGGPLSSTKDTHFLSEAIARFNQEAHRHNIVAEVIKFHPLLDNHRGLKRVYPGRISRICPTVYVDTTVDEDCQWKNVYSRINRQEINKAKRAGIQVEFVQSVDSWKAFEKFYAENMIFLKANNFYIFSPTYYEKIRQNLKNKYTLVSCSLDGEIISVMLVLLGFEFAHCHLIGTNPEFISKDVNKLLYHELFLWCKQNGYKKYHIGGGRTNDEDDSLFKFKRNFSKNVGSLHVGENVINAKIYNELCNEWVKRNPQTSTFGRLLFYRN